MHLPRDHSRCRLQCTVRLSPFSNEFESAKLQSKKDLGVAHQHGGMLGAGGRQVGLHGPQAHVHIHEHFIRAMPESRGEFPATTTGRSLYKSTHLQAVSREMCAAAPGGGHCRPGQHPLPSARSPPSLHLHY